MALVRGIYPNELTASFRGWRAAPGDLIHSLAHLFADVQSALRDLAEYCLDAELTRATRAALEAARRAVLPSAGHAPDADTHADTHASTNATRRPQHDHLSRAERLMHPPLFDILQDPVALSPSSLTASCSAVLAYSRLPAGHALAASATAWPLRGLGDVYLTAAMRRNGARLLYVLTNLDEIGSLAVQFCAGVLLWWLSPGWALGRTCVSGRCRSWCSPTSRHLRSRLVCSRALVATCTPRCVSIRPCVADTALGRFPRWQDDVATCAAHPRSCITSTSTACRRGRLRFPCIRRSSTKPRSASCSRSCACACGRSVRFAGRCCSC